MDRILRPTGFVIVHDKEPVIDFVKKYLTALHWESIATTDAQANSEDEEVVLVIQKKLWLIDEGTKDSA